MNVSLTEAQEQFVRAQVSAGRYRTASEVVRDGLRMLEEAEHRRLVEKWLYEDLSDEELAGLPDDVKQRARAHVRGLVDRAMADVEAGRVVDGPSALARMREALRAPSE
ncbi:MAG: type II toxin-antitoxin system ParD family antitoxin [Acidobacteriota bacterium]